MRLQDGTDDSNGRVEMCQNGTWGSVCNNTWDNTDARVLCAQLGYGNEGTMYTANSEQRNLKVTFSPIKMWKSLVFLALEDLC